MLSTVQIDHRPAREQIRDTIVDRILSGIYVAGQRLLELQLAEEFGTSQGPVREAIRELGTLGLLDVEPHRGTRVHGVPTCELIESLALRALLEEHNCASLAGRLGLSWAATRAHAEQALVHAESRDYAQFSAADARFHRSIMEASGNRVALHVWDGLQLRTRVRVTERGRVAPEEADFVRIALEHLGVVVALEGGDAAGAGALLRDHLEGLMRALIRDDGASEQPCDANRPAPREAADAGSAPAGGGD